MLEDIINYVQIRPDLGTSGQPDPNQFEDIQKAGYEVVINLVPSSSPDAVANERTIVTGLGMEYIHIPVIWQAPTRRDLDLFFEALQGNQGRRVFAHCVMNFRVSAFVFLYRVLQEGQPIESARQDMLNIWEPEPTWVAFIQTCLDER